MSILMPIFKRLLWSISLIFAVLVLNFLLIHSAPGGPEEVIAGEMGGVTEEILQEIRMRYGLDKPIYVQLWVLTCAL